MASESWMNGYVPKNYAYQTLASAQKNLQKETDALLKSSIEPNLHSVHFSVFTAHGNWDRPVAINFIFNGDYCSDFATYNLSVSSLNE
jgi:hypothetical protein